MLNCRQFTDLASDDIDLQHTGWKRLEIRAHLMICRHCRRFRRHLDRSRQTGAALAQQLWRGDDAMADMIFSRINPSNSGK
ncbi:zf-HC2 domain-containing protein [Zhongshania aquimaris]|uniref:Zf-HC2 domain-containing protein n=1 Tax=Zhongshania aquimaris TaxID=2857107 RepID=A0ABS6VUU7_9GAMM|nr:zf-HC2 domain-containing protein [Zhongshania aquimaris]MBW2942105.1 zf-HC2 domain-containing protein [Zhongshania aquimaris]